MTRADAAKLVGLVVTAYPNYDKFRDEQAVTATVNLWATMFENDDMSVVTLALRKHIATSKWPPSVAEIRERMIEICHPELIEPDRAWLAVADLQKTTGEHLQGDLHELLPPLIARAIEAIGWDNLWDMHRSRYSGGKPGMDRVAFMQQYEPMYERERIRAMTPDTITTAIDTARAALPADSQRLLQEREQKRRKQVENLRKALGNVKPERERRVLEAGQGVNA